uniref:Uncharacterized protein n=1 Tax=Anguilla anguilla TaxID=7936 RepID=A0A0E9UIS8_ANGAN
MDVTAFPFGKKTPLSLRSTVGFFFYLSIWPSSSRV